MHKILAITTVTGGINLPIRRAELKGIGLEPGSFSIVSAERMTAIYETLSETRSKMPRPRVGGAFANTAEFIARAGERCSLFGLGGDDEFGRRYVTHCEQFGLSFEGRLKANAITGYDFYLNDELGVRTIVLTQGANAALATIDIEAKLIETANMVALDGVCLRFGPHSRQAVEHCAELAASSNTPMILTLCSQKIVRDFRDFFAKYSARAALVAGNLSQFIQLLNLTPNCTVPELAQALRRAEINGLVTMDSRGCFALVDGQEFFVKTSETQVLDSVGAGDNFLGAYLVARNRGLGVKQALRLGNRVAGQIIQYDSARFPESVQVKKFVDSAIAEIINANEPTY